MFSFKLNNWYVNFFTIYARTTLTYLRNMKCKRIDTKPHLVNLQLALTLKHQTN